MLIRRSFICHFLSSSKWLAVFICTVVLHFGLIQLSWLHFNRHWFAPSILPPCQVRPFKDSCPYVSLANQMGQNYLCLWIIWVQKESFISLLDTISINGALPIIYIVPDVPLTCNLQMTFVAMTTRGFVKRTTVTRSQFLWSVSFELSCC